MKILKNLKHIFIIIGISLFFLFGSIVIFSDTFQSSINSFFIYRTSGGIWQDMFYTHTLRPSDHIALITIDDKTLNTLQAQSDQKMLSIQKSVYRDLITKLNHVGVRGVGFDIVFQNLDPTEKEFIQVLKKSPNVVIGTSVSDHNTCIKDTKNQVTCDGFPRLGYSAIPWGLVNIGSMIGSDRTNASIDVFSRPVKVDIKKTGSEASQWKYNLGLPTDVYNLPIALIQKTEPNILKNPLLRGSSVLNPFFGPPGSYRTYSLVDVLAMDDATLVQYFQGSYVFIGEAGTLIHDSLTSPVTDTEMAGVELHAHFLDGLLQDRMLQTFAYSFGVAVILCILSVFLYFLSPNTLSPIIAIVIICLILSVSRYLYDRERLVVDIFPLFLAGGVLTLPMTFIYRFFIVDRERRFIENAFSHYIDPHVVGMINSEEVAVTLGGERREVSVFFSDIAGFTTISEKLGPQDLFQLMSLYLSRMTDILTHEGGTLDKYIGDAVMGFFGAPVPEPDHAVRACRTALLMREALPAFNRDLEARGMDPLDFRVGIATGEVMIGNIGSTEHFNYTVLGDTVNLASRLEGAGKEYHVHIIISGGTRAMIPDEFVVRELDTLAVKGKTEGVQIYELIGMRSPTIMTEIYETYERALSLYRAGSYIDAGKLWESIADRDPPSDMMMRRCIEVIQGEIQVENGVYHMKTK